MLPLQAAQTVAVAIFSGHRPPEGLQDLVPRIAPRAVLLILAGNGRGGEELNRTYAARAGAGTQLWEIAEASHTGGIREQPAAYERRVVAFLDRSLGVQSLRSPLRHGEHAHRPRSCAYCDLTSSI